MADEPTTSEATAVTDEPVLRPAIADPYAALPDDPVAEVTGVDFPVTLRGYDRGVVDAYVRRVGELVRELHAVRSPEAAVQRAVERVGGEVGEILKRAHATAEEVTSKSRAEAEERLRSSREESDETLRGARTEAEQTLSSARTESEQTLSGARAEAEQTLSNARQEAEELRVRAHADVEEILTGGRQRVKDLDADADRVWAERRRIVEDVRNLAGQLAALAESASERFPAEEPGEGPLLEIVESPSVEVPTRVLRAVAPVHNEPADADPDSDPDTDAEASWGPAPEPGVEAAPESEPESAPGD